MEHETWDSHVIEGRRTRPVDPAVKASRHQTSAPEQAAIEGSPVLRPSVVLGLQRTAGNGAVSALIQRSAALSEEGEDPTLVREIVGKGHGQPLDPMLQQDMETRLGEDFSDVRVHTDAAAAKSAAAVSARAYTVANEVVFGADAPALDSAAGKRVLAHELTHVVQQRHGPVAGTPAGNGVFISDPSDTFEQAAEANAERVMSARPEGARIGDSPHSQPTAAGAALGAAQGTSLQLQPADTSAAEDYEQEDEEAAGAAAPGEAATEAGEQLGEPEAEVEAGGAAEVEAGEAPETAEAPGAAAAAPAVEMEAASQPMAAVTEAGGAEAAPAAEQEMAQEEEAEAATEFGEDQASEVEVEEDQMAQAEAGVEQAEEGVEQADEEEEEQVAV